MSSIEEKIFSKLLSVTKPLANQASIDKQRKTHERVLGLMPIPKNVTIAHVDNQETEAQWLCPENCCEDNIILYFHGGGYIKGSVNSAKAIASKIAAESGIGVLTFQYRLAPEHPFPAALHDAYNMYRFLLDKGMKSNNIAFVGESAGGGLELGLCHYLQDNDLPLPSCIAALSPWTDLTLSGASYIEREESDPVLLVKSLAEFADMYAGDEKKSNCYISPLFGSFKDFPPTLIHVGTNEILFDDANKLYENMKLSGIQADIKIWDEMWHMFQGYGTPTSKQAIKEICIFLRQHLKMETVQCAQNSFSS